MTKWTAKNFNELMKEAIYHSFTPNQNFPSIMIRKKIILGKNNDLTMSVQASYYHYSKPQKEADFYKQWEIGYPSKQEELLMPYAENVNNPTETIYAFVPTRVILQLIRKYENICNIDTAGDYTIRRSAFL
jgi:hypothetical protein